MDQGHGHSDSMGGWDSNTFMPAGDWSHHFDPAALGFSQGTGAEFLDSGAINPQLSVQSEFHNFNYIPQNHGHSGQGDVWQNHAPPVTHYAQEQRVQQPYFTTHQFAPDIHETGAQDLGHSFQNNGIGISNGSAGMNSGYSQGPVPQWQGQVQGGYAANGQFSNPLAAAGQVSSLSPPLQTASPAPFASSTITDYQQEVRQPQRLANSRPQHGQFPTGLNGQSHQTNIPAPQVPVAASGHRQVPQQANHGVEQRLNVFSTTTPLTNFSQPPPDHVRHGVVSHSSPAVPDQVNPTPQTTQSPQVNPGSGQKRPSPSDVQGTQLVAKKARTSPPQAANLSTSLGTSLPQNYPEVTPPVFKLNYVDHDLLNSARGRGGARWPAVPNLIIGAEPVILNKGPPTMRFVHLYTNNPGKAPLFPEIPCGWIQAESFGNHRAVYENNSSKEIDKFRADKRLEVEFNRGYNRDHSVLAAWIRKVYEKFEKGRPAGAKLHEGFGEPENTGILAEETIRLHPLHRNNSFIAESIKDSYQRIIGEICGKIKDQLKEPSKNMSGIKAETALLERVILAGTEHVDPDLVFDFPTFSNKHAGTVFNALVRTVNAGKTEPYVKHVSKVILRLFTCFNKMTPGFLRKIKMQGVYKLFVKKGKGDEEMKALLNRIYEIAEQNGGGDSSDDDSSGSSTDRGSGAKSGAAARQKESAGSTTSGKKVVSNSVPTKGENKQSNSVADSKKVIPPLSLSKPTKSTSDTKKLPANNAPSIKTMAPGSDPKKAAAKEGSKSISGSSSSSGTKRSRDDDAGNDVRSAKKPTTAMGAAVTAGTKGPSTASLSVGKSAATKVTTVLAKPASGNTPSVLAAASNKSRSGLLPGKARLTTKATPSNLEPLKPQATQKNGAIKSDVAQLTKAPAPSAAASAAAKPTKSAFSALMDEINDGDGKKRITTSILPVKKEREIPENETPEEKGRRLRKEKRRALGLKVAFKIGDGLVEIREFTREPEEIESQSKAVGASSKHNEAEHFRIVNSKMGIKDQEVAGRDWEAPIPVNFAHIPQEKREETFETRGGLTIVSTPEQKVIEEHDRNELLVIYHALSDVPPTPRSPTYEPSFDNTASETQLPPSIPEYEEIKRRNWEHRNWGPRPASRAAQARLDAKVRPDYVKYTQVMESVNSIAESNVKSQAQSQTPVMDARTWFDPATAARRDQATLVPLTSDRVKNWNANTPNPYTPKPLEALDKNVREALDKLTSVCKLSETSRAQQQAFGQPSVAAQPQTAAYIPPPAAADVQAPLPAPQTAVTDHAAAWALYYQQQQLQQQQQQQHQAYYGQHQPQLAQVQPQQQQAPDLAAILAQLGPQQPAAPPAQHPAQVQAIMAALAGTISNQVPAAYAVQPPQPAYQQQPAYGQHEGYRQSQSQSYGQSNQDPYASMYDEPAYPPPQQSSYQERDHDGGHNGYGRDRDRDGGSRDRDRDRDRDGRDRPYHTRGGNGGSHKRRNNNNEKNGGNKDDVPEHLRGINQRLIGTKQCAFWAKGTCAKGDKCTFRHD